MPEPIHTAQRSWVTVVGWSPMAVINTIWQACEKGIVPDRGWCSLRHAQKPACNAA